MSTEGSRKAVLAAGAANLAIAFAKLTAFFVTGSSSMLSEGIHSIADTGNQGLLLWGNKHAKAGSTTLHPFGRGGARYVYGFIVAVMLFLLGGAFSLYEGIHKIQHPEELHDVWIAIGVLAVAIIAESLSFRTAIKVMNKERRKNSPLNYIRVSRKPELPVILLEDFGALIGLVIATVFVGLSAITKNGICQLPPPKSRGLSRDEFSLMGGIRVVVQTETTLWRCI